MKTGMIEVEVDELNILNTSAPNLPFSVGDYHKVNWQAFRFMVGPGHCPMISKYGPSLSKAVGTLYPSFLVKKKSHLMKYSSYSKSTISTKQKGHVDSQYCKTILSSHSKKTKQRS